VAFSHYVGAVNGGVWVAHDGGTSWTPLTDKEASISIASLALDPTNSKNLLAGTGSCSTARGRLGSRAARSCDGYAWGWIDFKGRCCYCPSRPAIGMELA
jgi:hypothetical protein